MKPQSRRRPTLLRRSFSALGRAVWDETRPEPVGPQTNPELSVLSVEPYGMKHPKSCIPFCPFWLSVLSVEPYGMKLLYSHQRRWPAGLSVLSVEPYGMKLEKNTALQVLSYSFSALGRAVWDETGREALE